MKLTHQVCSLYLSLMIYMFTLIRMGKDRKDRDKDWIFCIYNVNTTTDSIFSSWFLLKCSPPCWIYNKVTYQVWLYLYNSSLESILFFLCSQSTYIYCYIGLDRHHTICLLSNIHQAATQILLSFILFTMWQLNILDMAPNLWHFLLSILLYEFYIGTDSMCLKLCYCNCYLFDVVSTSPVVWSQVRWFFLMRIIFCTINHDE